jgi:hypothetical protein
VAPVRERSVPIIVSALPERVSTPLWEKNVSAAARAFSGEMSSALREGTASNRKAAKIKNRFFFIY